MTVPLRILILGAHGQLGRELQRSFADAFGFTKVRYRGLKKNHEWLWAGSPWRISISTTNGWLRSSSGSLLWGHSLPAGDPSPPTAVKPAAEQRRVGWFALFTIWVTHGNRFAKP